MNIRQMTSARAEADVANIINAVVPVLLEEFHHPADLGRGRWFTITSRRPAGPRPTLSQPGMCADNPILPARRLRAWSACSDSATGGQKFAPWRSRASNAAGFNQYGVRLRLWFISPFANGLCSHTLGDHGSILALIESASTERASDDARRYRRTTSRICSTSTIRPRSTQGFAEAGAAGESSDPGCSGSSSHRAPGCRITVGKCS